MNYARVTPDYAAAAQIAPEDLAEIAALGYRSVMCNRPDGEEPGQPAFALIAQAARTVDLAAAHVPVVSGHILPEDVARAEATSHAAEHGFDAPVSDPHGAALFEYALRLGDDALILGQRLSAWTGRSPTIEVDLSLANFALDLVGQATHFLNYAGKVEGRGRDGDQHPRGPRPCLSGPHLCLDPRRDPSDQRR